MMEQVSQHQHATPQREDHSHLRKRQPLALWFTRMRKHIVSWLHMAPTPRRSLPTRTASILQRLLQGVLWAAFGAFLFASLPHVAYFFAAFEPEGSNGSLNEYWWFVSYGLAASIDVTAFLLSLNVALKLKDFVFDMFKIFTLTNNRHVAA